MAAGASSFLAVTGHDSLVFGGVVSSATIVGSSNGSGLIIASAEVVSSTLQGGSGDDTLVFYGLSTGAFIGAADGSDSLYFAADVVGATINGGDGGDTLAFAVVVTRASILGGAGSDSLVFAAAQTSGSTATTYFFGYESGADTLSFGGQSSTLAALTLAISDRYGSLANTSVSTS